MKIPSAGSIISGLVNVFFYSLAIIGIISLILGKGSIGSWILFLIGSFMGIIMTAIIHTSFPVLEKVSVWFSIVYSIIVILMGIISFGYIIFGAASINHYIIIILGILLSLGVYYLLNS